MSAAHLDSLKMVGDKFSSTRATLLAGMYSYASSMLAGAESSPALHGLEARDIIAVEEPMVGFKRVVVTHLVVGFYVQLTQPNGETARLEVGKILSMESSTNGQVGVRVWG